MHGFVSLDAEVDAVFDLFTVEDLGGQGCHGVAGVRGVPEGQGRHGAVLEDLRVGGGHARAGGEDFALEAEFFDGACGAGRVEGGGAEDALDFGVLLEDFLGGLVGGFTVVLGFDAGLGFEQRHLGVLLLLVGDGAVCPFVVGGVGDVADHGGVDAFFTHGLGEVVHDERAVFAVVEGFDVVHRVLLGGAFVGDDDDAGVHGLLEDGFDSAGVDGDDADGVDALGDEVLDDLGLHGGVGFSGALLEGVHAGVFGVLLDAGFHADEPGVGGVLGDDGDRVVAVSAALRCGAGRGLCGVTGCTGAEGEGACGCGDEGCSCEAGLHRSLLCVGQRRC